MVGQRNKKRKIALTDTKERNSYLTPKKFLELSLSQAIFQVIEDVRTLTNRGISMYMNAWFETTNGKLCEVCLGGAALCSFAPNKVNGYNVREFGKIVLGLDKDQADRILCTFDDLRKGDLHHAFKEWYDKDVPEELWSYQDDLRYRSGNVEGAELQAMLRSLKDTAGALAKRGY